MMRILMLCPQFYPLVGGYERAAERLSRELVRNGVSVTIITDRRDRKWPAAEVHEGIHVVRLPCWFRPHLHLATSLVSHMLWLLLHGREFDVWHVHQYGTHGTLAVLMGKLLRRPVVLKLTGSGEGGIAVALKEARLSRLQRWAHRQVAGCIAVSDETVVEAAAFGIPVNRIHAIGNGVDLRAMTPATAEVRKQARNQLGLGRGFIAIGVGRIASEKNLHGLLRAWATALRSLPPRSQLVWIGDGPLRALVETDIVQLGLVSSVRLVGHSDEVGAWMNSADLFLLPSRTEGMANTLLEAMAFGLPSVAAAVSGVPQLVGVANAGEVVPIGDMDAFAEAIVSLANDSETGSQMGKRARQVIERSYSLDKITERIMGVYERVIAEN